MARVRYMKLLTMSQKVSRKPPEIYKKISGQKSRNDFVGFLEEVFRPKEHFEINWPLRTLRNPFQLSEKKPTMFVCTFDTFTNNLVYFSSKYLTRNWSQMGAVERLRLYLGHH